MQRSLVWGCIGGVVIAVALGGCQGSSGPGAVRVALEGVNSTATSVVAVRAGDGAGLHCSGVAIGPSAIVTAAFCVLEYSASAVRVYPNGLEGGAASGLEVAEIRIDPWDAGVGGSYRLAVLRTSSAHGVPVAARALAPPTVGDAVTIVGFGESIATPDVFGETRREAEVTVATLQATPDESIPSFETVPSVICDGDGGGGVFASDGSLLGVINGGANPCNGEPTGDSGTNIIELAAHADFLDGALAPPGDVGPGDEDAATGEDGGGTLPDAGPVPDAGSDGGADTGTGTGTSGDGGCSCSAVAPSNGRTPRNLLMIVIVAGFVVRRSRRAD